MVTANGEVLTEEEATVCVRELDLSVKVMVLEAKMHRQFFHSESSAKITGKNIIGPVVRNHISSKMAGRSIATQRTTYLSLKKKRNLNEDNERVRGNPLRDLPEWLREFTENVVDESVPAHMDAPASSSRESASEPRGKVVLGKHSIYTYFPKDRNCDICMGTKITRVYCRKRTGTVVPRAENFGDLITADHKVLSDGCESRNNHRYAVVVQDLATQWIQSYPCKTKTSQETEKRLQKFLEPTWKPKVFYVGNSPEYGKACEDSSWNHSTSSPHRSETNGIVERAVHRIKEGTSAVLLQSGLNEK